MADQAYLDGATWGAWAGGLRAYLSGDPEESDTPFLIPVVGGVESVDPDDAVPFVHDGLSTEVDSEVNPMTGAGFVVYVADKLVERSVYAYDGDLWTVEECEIDRAASVSVAWPYRTILVRHAQQ